MFWSLTESMSFSPAVIPVVAGGAIWAVLPAIGAMLVSLLRPSGLRMAGRVIWRLKYSLVCIAGIVFGLIHLVGAVMPAGAGTVTADAAGKSDWAMFRGNPLRSGSSSSMPDPTQGGVNWSFKDDATVFSSPAVVANRVFFTSANYGPMTDNGAIWCLDTDTGGLVWKAVPKGYLATFSSPSVSGKYLVAGEGLHFTKKARVVCLDITQKGKVLWEYRTSSHVESSPCIADGKVFIGAGDDGYYCFELAGDGNGNAKMLWHTDPKQYLDCETSPVAVGGKVYVGLGMGGKAVCCLDAATGKEIWRRPAPFPVFAAPTVVDGKVLVGMGNGNFIEEAEAIMVKEVQKMRDQGKSEAEINEARKTLGPAGEVWCLDAATGNPVWTVKLGRTVLGAVAATKDRVYFGSRDGHVYCYSLDGKPRGKYNAHAPIVTSPAVTAGHVYVVTETGRLYGLDADTLELVWDAQIGATGPFFSSPAVARGRVFVGSQNDGLVCLGEPGKPKEPLWSGHLGGPGRGGSADRSPLSGDRGSLLWRYTGASSTTQPVGSIQAPAALLGESIYVPLTGARRGVLAVKNDPKIRTSRDVRELWHYATPLDVTLSPAASGQAVVLVDGAAGQDGRSVHCLDPATGGARWKLPVAAGASGQLTMLYDLVIASVRQGALSAIGLDGKILWEQTVGKLSGPAAFRGSLILAAVADPSPELLVLDRQTGAIVQRSALPDAPTTSPAIDGSVTYVGTARGLCAIDITTGAPLWSGADGAATGHFALLREHVAYINAVGEIVILDRASGKLKHKAPGARADVPLLAARDELLYASADAIMLISVEDGKPREWMNLSDWPWKLTTGMVLADGRVFFGTDNGGLVCVGKRKGG